MKSCGAAPEAASTRTNDKWKRTKWKESQWDQQGNEIGLGKWLWVYRTAGTTLPLPCARVSSLVFLVPLSIWWDFTRLPPVFLFFFTPCGMSQFRNPGLMIASVVGGIITVSAPLPPHDCFGHNVFLWWPPTLPSLAAILNSSSILEYLTASAQPHRFGMESCC